MFKGARTLLHPLQRLVRLCLQPAQGTAVPATALPTLLTTSATCDRPPLGVYHGTTSVSPNTQER